MVTKKDYKELARLIGQLSFNFKNGSFTGIDCSREHRKVDDSHFEEARVIDELKQIIDESMKKMNDNYNEQKFWDAVYKYRKDILDIIFN